jgi:hypothetical protein
MVYRQLFQPPGFQKELVALLLLFREWLLAPTAEVESRDAEMLDSVGDGGLGRASLENEVERTLCGSDCFRRCAGLAREDVGDKGVSGSSSRLNSLLIALI